MTTLKSQLLWDSLSYPLKRIYSLRFNLSVVRNVRAYNNKSHLTTSERTQDKTLIQLC